jgi:tRNA (cytidine/uridine-2'-O-)-methyltransferase
VRVATQVARDANAKATFQCRRKRVSGYGLRGASVKVVLRRAGVRRMPRTSSTTPRLRAKPLTTALHIVLVEPEIPPNTGNVARLAAATASPMHLVGNLGFRIDDHSVRRAGVDYWHLVDVRQHVDFEHFLHAFSRESPGGKLHLFSAIATTSYLDAAFAPGDALVFGKESVGLSEEVLARFPDRTVGIPTLGAVRSLNLANAVGIALYEALRQTGTLATTFTG